MAAPIAVAGIGATLLGGLVSAQGAQQQGQATAAMYGYQSTVAQLNANIAQQNASYAAESGEVQAQDAGLQTRAQVGGTRVAAGAGNIDPNTGSTANVVSSEEEIGREKEGVVRFNAAQKAYGFNVAAANDQAQSSIYTAAVSNTLTATSYNVATSLLGAAGSAASKWTQAQTAFGSSFPFSS